MFLFSPKFDWSFSRLSKFNWSFCTLPKRSYFTQMFLILPTTLLKFFSWPKFDEVFGFITWFRFTQGQCLFCHQGQKGMAKLSVVILPFCLLFCRWFGYYFALVWKIDTTSFICECSCIFCPNCENFCPNNGQFFNIGDANASPASPWCTLMNGNVSLVK